MIHAYYNMKEVFELLTGEHMYSDPLYMSYTDNGILVDLLGNGTICEFKNNLKG